NEVAILPYYIANLNIEYTYKQKTGEYAEFDNLCFVDTLDNTGFHWAGKQGDLFGVSAENALRIRRQNERKISVIIGNPPYNALQVNANDNNQNRKYPQIDNRIKETFIKYSTATNLTKVFDMYTRFYRWAMDRLDENGIVALVTNRSFIESRILDGFRKTVRDEYDFIYIVDTKSDVRANPKITGTKHNVFGIQTGIAIMFLVKTTSRQIKQHSCKINYIALNDFWTKEEKLQWLNENRIEEIEFDNITPDRNNNWINLTDNNWNDLIPVATKESKAGKIDNSIFKLFSMGVVTARDEWVYDFNKEVLIDKATYFFEKYNYVEQKYNSKLSFEEIGIDIKWSRNLKNFLFRKEKLQFKESCIVRSLKRPFVKEYLYYDRGIINDLGYYDEIYKGDNKTIAINMNCDRFVAVGTNLICDFALIKIGNGQTQCLPLYRYGKEGNRIDNISDWGLQQFTRNYKDQTITKESIFHYVYSVLHNPAYRKKYELNLKREFPRIPFYENFSQWATWGKQLMDLHINYETVEPYNLERKEISAKEQPKAKLKALKDIGVIQLDENTEVHGIPKEAWEYKLGNRSALEWILHQYKEKKPSDPTIAEKFNTYKFADYKEQVIDLLKRVCTVSVETMKVVREMEKVVLSS
ncbi:MAG: type ISP restriction/modification enzyme, partial [Parafilimonas sp.]